MPRRFWIVASLFVAATHCSAQNPCQTKLGTGNVVVLLRDGPNAFEPVCQPERIRVNDRTKVTIHVVGVSPTESCVITSTPPAVTAVANPLEGIINSLTGLKNFSFGDNQLSEAVQGASGLLMQPMADYVEAVPKHKLSPKEQEEANKRKADAAKAKEQDENDAAAFALFVSLSKGLEAAAKPVFTKEATWQERYKNDLLALSTYLNGDFRTTNYVKFTPSSDAKVAQAQIDAKVATLPSASPDIDMNAVPSEVDYLKLQSLYDQMKLMQPRIVTACTTAGKRCNSETLRKAGYLLDLVNSYLLIAQDNLKVLQAAQASLATASTSLDTVVANFKDRMTRKALTVQSGVLVEDIPLGPDYYATNARSLSCSTIATPVQATTDAISVSVLYQNIPALTLSTGLLTTFLTKQEIGTSTKLNADGTYSTYFAVTDQARASVFPMAFVNYRISPAALRHWWGQPENELAITNNISTGIGVNPNTGTNQVEFFLGDAVGFNRVLIHFGAHFGRTESIGGGYVLNTNVPTGFTGQPPIAWSYHPAFSIGFSVRTAPW